MMFRALNLILATVALVSTAGAKDSNLKEDVVRPKNEAERTLLRNPSLNVFKGRDETNSTSQKYVAAGLYSEGALMCWDKKQWCDEVYYYAKEHYKSFAFPPDSGITGEIFAGFVRDVYCKAAAKAFLKFHLIFVAQGDFVVKRGGAPGKVTEINLGTNIQHAQAVLVKSEAAAEAEAGANAYVFSSLSNCNSYGVFPVQQLLCQAAFGLADSLAIADAASSSSSMASALGKGQLGSQVHIRGENIDKFVASVYASGSNFVGAKSESFASALAYAFAAAISENCLKVCENFFFFPSCEDACLWGESVADALAESYALAVAKAMSKLEFDILFHTMFVNRIGFEDFMYFGLDSSIVAGVRATCDAKAGGYSAGGGYAGAYGGN